MEVCAYFFTLKAGVFFMSSDKNIDSKNCFSLLSFFDRSTRDAVYSLIVLATASENLGMDQSAESFFSIAKDLVIEADQVRDIFLNSQID
jgi:hypothetical protein